MENARQQTKAFILDVDLDYFSTIAFLALLTRLQTATVSSVEPQHEEIVRELLPFYPEDVGAERLLGEFLVLLAQYQDDKATQSEIWTAGPFLDLPHHESSPEEIQRMVNELEQFLHANALDAANPPALVTIAKSTGDEFLPPHQLDIVLSSVLQMLERVFGELSMRIVEYESIDDEGEAVRAARAVLG
ncbi:hypothetical protein BBJ28_00009842 [Nothophytophthora sp. Chile5]|nr:hypothetical protein BBJ28_00009842 [Nothophytophthora sp. Chile5]